MAQVESQGVSPVIHSSPCTPAVSEYQDNVSFLIKAVKLGSTEDVLQAIAGGAHVNGTDERGWTALHWAAAMGQADMAELLCGHGADPAMTSETSKSPLDIAVLSGSAEVIDLLIDVRLAAMSAAQKATKAQTGGYDRCANNGRRANSEQIRRATLSMRRLERELRSVTSSDDEEWSQDEEAEDNSASDYRIVLEKMTNSPFRFPSSRATRMEPLQEQLSGCSPSNNDSPTLPRDRMTQPDAGFVPRPSRRANMMMPLGAEGSPQVARKRRRSDGDTTKHHLSFLTHSHDTLPLTSESFSMDQLPPPAMNFQTVGAAANAFQYSRRHSDILLPVSQLTLSDFPSTDSLPVFTPAAHMTPQTWTPTPSACHSASLPDFSPFYAQPAMTLSTSQNALPQGLSAPIPYDAANSNIDSERQDALGGSLTPDTNAEMNEKPALSDVSNDYTIAKTEIEQSLDASTGGIFSDASQEKKVCTNCGTSNTPQWRSGDKGPGTLCNRCGLKYMLTHDRDRLNARRRIRYHKQKAGRTLTGHMSQRTPTRMPMVPLAPAPMRLPGGFMSPMM